MQPPSNTPGSRLLSRLRRNAKNYLLALLFVLLAHKGILLFMPVIRPVFLLYCTAIALSAIQGGFGPGVFATMLCALLSSYYFLPPDHSFAVDRVGAIRLILLSGAGALLSMQCERLHSARRAADRRWLEIEEAERRQDLLTQLGAPLTAAAPLELSLQNVALILTRKFADLCLIDVMREDNALRRVAFSSSDLLTKDFAEQMALRYPVESALTYGPPEIVRAGRPEVIRRLNPDAPHHQILQSAGFRSFLSLPLYAPGRRLGVVTLAFAETQSDLRPEELALATEVTRLIAIRVANESLLWAAQDEINRLKSQLNAA